MTIISRVIVIVLDSVGVGELPDAAAYGDEGSNTLANTARAVGGLFLPHLGALGLGNIVPVQGVPPAVDPRASYGKMATRSAGKDTTTGHWELAGLILPRAFPVYPEGFPGDLIAAFEARIGRGTLGNRAASGTVIIEELGEAHLRTGRPIVYTSADSVFQVAAHESVIPVDELYRICRVARGLLAGEHAVGRVIARPFAGEPGSFERTPRRRDFSLAPTGRTILETLRDEGLAVVGVGKIGNIFAETGLTDSRPTWSNEHGVDTTLEVLRTCGRGLVFVNLIEFDMLYGHRNDPAGYAGALEAFDRRLPEILEALGAGDLLLITADHGCDPTTPGTDHSREYVPLLAFGTRLAAGIDLGTRSSLTDVAATVAEVFGLKWPVGESFYRRIVTG
ncbi:MAG: phosphopentomutase [Candidatus Desulforudis sp.]|nr:phosphopentomutase [Desulforudis sp.]